jgi:RNA polymerase sigma factor (sigma-70 family)
MADDDRPKPRRPRKRSLLSVERRREVLEQLVLIHRALTDTEIGLLDEVFDDIFEAHEDDVRRRLQRRDLDPGIVDDLLQASMIDGYLHLIGHGFPENLGALLQVIARRKASHFVRDRGRSPVSDAGLPSSGSEKPRSGPGSGPDGVMDRRTKAEYLLDQLTPAQRELFDLVYRQELSFAEVAALLGIPEGTLKSRMLALRKVLAAMAEEFE